MDQITLAFPYQGAIIETNIQPEDSIRGTVYLVELNGNYHFTLYQDEEEDWCILKEADASVPLVEIDLYDKIVKKLQYELRYAA